MMLWAAIIATVVTGWAGYLVDPTAAQDYAAAFGVVVVVLYIGAVLKDSRDTRRARIR